MSDDSPATPSTEPKPLDAEMYAHLHALASQIYRERGNGMQTIQPTVLLHEAWIRLERSGSRFNDRQHFVAVAARAMRQVLVDQARRRAADKRGGGQHRTTLSGVALPERQLDVVELQRALDELEAVDPRAAEVVMLRVFGGMSVPEIATTMSLGVSTVDRAWSRARSFLNAVIGR
ncbi:MAG: RNA polymerase sigma factor (TIGR02999 family) [Myxococcota bacterium]